MNETYTYFKLKRGACVHGFFIVKNREIEVSHNKPNL